MILGIKSRTGLIAYPVGPPNEKPITTTIKATGKAPKEPRPMATSPTDSDSNVGPVMYKTPKMSTKVAIASVIMFHFVFLRRQF